MLRRYIYSVLVFLVLMCTGCQSKELEEIPLEDIVLVENQTEERETHIYVFVCGAVVRPGVYELEEGSRVFEAIEAAGGFTKEASKNMVNQAEILKDEMKVYVPTQKEVEVQNETDSGKININTAAKSELMELPGVGEAKADQIIQYREAHGSFRQIEDIMSISGIKEGLFEKIKEYITV